MDTCRFVQRDDASSLMPWRNCDLPLSHGQSLKGHYWEQGTPLPDQAVLDLIGQYVEISSAWELPEWVRDLRAHREEAKQEEEGGPWRRAHREKADQEEQQYEEARKVAEEEQEVDQGGNVEKVAVAEEEQEPDQGGTGQKVA